MDFEIRIGEDLVCEYSQQPSNILIKFKDFDGRPSSWFGPDALNKAIKIINAVSPNTINQQAQQVQQVQQAQQDHQVQQDQKVQSIRHQEDVIDNEVKQKPLKQKAPESKEVVEGFASGLVNIVKKAAEDDEPIDNRKIVALLRNWRLRFRDINNAYPIVRFHIPSISKDRFDDLVATAKIVDKQDEDE